MCWFFIFLNMMLNMLLNAVLNLMLDIISLKYFYSQLNEYFQPKVVGKIFFVMKQKFLENRWDTFVDIEKNFTKTEWQTKLIWFRTVGASISHEGIVKLDTIRKQFSWQIFKRFFWKIFSDNIWGMIFLGKKVLLSCG